MGLEEFKTFKLPPVDLDELTIEINDSPIAPKLISINYAQPNITIIFAAPLDPDVDEIILNGIIQKHGTPITTQSVQNKYILESTPLHTVSKWMKIAGSTTDDTSQMVVLDEGQTIGTYFVTMSGSEPDVYATLVYDWGGVNEKIIASTRSSKDWTLNPKLPENQVTGDGIAKFGIVLVNESTTESPVVGGHFETTEIK